VGESATLADMLVVSEGHASEATAHFNETAKSLIRGLMVHVATLPPEQRNMGEVRRLLMLGGADFDVVLAQMIANPRGYDLPARAANAFNDAPDKERGSILSTARRHLAFLDDPRIVAALSRSDFSPDDLKARKITVYLVMPPARLSANRAFVRAFFGQAINAVMASAGKPPYRVLFLLDEFPQLGRMDIVEEKLPLIRGYGGAFWLVAQNLDQLKKTYPRWQNFVANCGAKQFFGTADVETARYVSDSLGRMTVEFQTANTSTSAGQSFSSGSGVSQQFTGRELLTADEIMRLPREHEIVLINGEAPWMLTRLNYLTDPEYAGRFDANPYE
jgi:type IV secretion system protein VirD4